MFINKMEAVIYNQDLCRYICGFLTPTDTVIMTQLNREIREATINILPKYYGKNNHLKKLKQKYNFKFLQECVQTNLQAELLYNSYFKNINMYNLGPYYGCGEDRIELTGKMRKIYNLFRFRKWKRKGHPSTDRINKKLKLLVVL